MRKIEFIDLAAQHRRLADRIDARIKRVLEHGAYIMGPEVAELEAELSAFCGARHCITCSNGTDALALVLRAWAIGRDDAVICPSFTFASTAEVVAWLGATPVFADIDPDTYNLSPNSLIDAIATARQLGLAPRAIIAVDLFGQPADYDRIQTIAREQGLKLLCDSAQAFGSTYRGRRSGTIGDATTTSFFPAKPLGCYGDGGAIFTGDDELAEVLRSLRVHGKGADKYDNVRIGINGRLDTIQAAILIEKLAIFSDEIAERNRIAQVYTDGLGDVCRTPVLLPGATSVWAQYTIRVPAENREGIRERLAAAGVPTAVYYPKPLHRQTAYRDYPTAGDLGRSAAASESVLSLPMHPYLDADQQARIITGVMQAATDA